MDENIMTSQPFPEFDRRLTVMETSFKSMETSQTELKLKFETGQAKIENSIAVLTNAFNESRTPKTTVWLQTAGLAFTVCVVFISAFYALINVSINGQFTTIKSDMQRTEDRLNTLNENLGKSVASNVSQAVFADFKSDYINNRNVNQQNLADIRLENKDQWKMITENNKESYQRELILRKDIFSSMSK